MGWFGFWSSSDSNNDTSPTPETASTPSPSVSLTEEQRQRIFGRPSPSQPQPQSQRDHDDENADAELNELIKAFETSTSPNPTTTPKPPTPPHSQLRNLPDGSLDISPSAILPRTMSCRQQFDQAFYCQSLGGKFNDIYRHGHLKSCSEQWGAFWFCMRTRTLPAREKEELIMEFYRKRDEKRREEGGSSEDVWECRTRAVERAFWKDPDFEGDDEGNGEVKGMVR